MTCRLMLLALCVIFPWTTASLDTDITTTLDNQFYWRGSLSSFGQTSELIENLNPNKIIEIRRASTNSFASVKVLKKKKEYTMFTLHHQTIWVETPDFYSWISKAIEDLKTNEVIDIRSLAGSSNALVTVYSHKKKEYTLFKEPKSFDDAKKDCAQRGLRLSTVTNEEEHRRVAELVKPLGSEWRLVWLGGSDRQLRGRYVWESSGQPVTYTAWDDGQPNHVPYKEETQRCIVAWPHTGRWYDYWCSWPLPYICESLCQC